MRTLPYSSAVYIQVLKQLLLMIESNIVILKSMRNTVTWCLLYLHIHLTNMMGQSSSCLLD